MDAKLFGKTMHNLTGRLENIAWKGKNIATEAEKPELRERYRAVAAEIARRHASGFALCRRCKGTGEVAIYYRTDNGRCHACAGTGFAGGVDVCGDCGEIGKFSQYCPTHEAARIAQNAADTENGEFLLF